MENNKPLLAHSRVTPVVLKSARSAISADSADGRYLQAAACVCALCGEMTDKRRTLGSSQQCDQAGRLLT